MSSKLWNTISIQEVILQSTFSRIFTSYSEQERVNANGPNYATRYFVNEMSVAFYSCALTLPCGANSSILKNCMKIDHFSQSQSHNWASKASPTLLGVQSRFRVKYIYICCRYVVCLSYVKLTA